ncbi:Ethanolamine ammonia-lyase light chain [Novosphingobium nitrogenifigens DSM 19370]|uniref:Ethanolamine ammonia-lyase small subunit n=1 Tax=Novosphingobium nitrogenifigens DSM 19370 TaxID=983920 RepID=F1ZBD5_9SPHN|nr:ethanolamine ammonia-lyase subunit EutC [Novosphingobium nitrogenifigens]EGD58167.1 Ethanolamine ammonia-lyase light chain [Novosphingobium nitrogenifigens DSM 19370]
MSDEVERTPPDAAALWQRLRAATPARIGLGRVGNTQPLKDVLRFQLDHARARDAVHAPFDAEALAAELAPLSTLIVESEAIDRATYLRRPDLGRRLSVEGKERLAAAMREDPSRLNCDVAIVVGDGLSATGVQGGGAALVRALVRELGDLSLAPVVIARQARVALGDDIGEAMRARVVVMIIGERPGLTVADSLGIYMTFAPRRGRADSERNCISNIHAQGGLAPEQAAATLGRLLREAMRRGLSGVDIKDDAETLLSPPPALDTP